MLVTILSFGKVVGRCHQFSTQSLPLFSRRRRLFLQLASVHYQREHTVLLIFLCGYTALISPTHFLFSARRYVYYFWMWYVLNVTFIIRGCNISIWRKFRHRIVASQQQTGNSRNKRLTKTLLFVCILALLCWITLVILNGLIFVYDVQTLWQFYDLVNLINYYN